MRQYLLPVLLSNPWELLLRLLIMPCYASRRGLGECIHDRCEIVKLTVYLRWQLKHTSGWIEAPGYSRTCLFSFGPPPRLKGIMRLFILETSVCSHKLLWALAQLTKSCELLQWQTSRCRGCRWYGLPDRKVLALLKDYVSVIRLLKHHVVRENKRRRSSLVGKSAQTSAECIN